MEKDFPITTLDNLSMKNKLKKTFSPPSVYFEARKL